MIYPRLSIMKEIDGMIPGVFKAFRPVLLACLTFLTLPSALQSQTILQEVSIRYPMKGAVLAVHPDGRSLYIRRESGDFRAWPDPDSGTVRFENVSDSIDFNTGSGGDRIQATSGDGTVWWTGADCLYRLEHANRNNPGLAVRVDGRDGLPVAGFTCLAGGPGDALWIGTTQGMVIHRNGRFSYRQGPRWLPDDHVFHIASDGAGGAWVATGAGLAHFKFVSMDLMDKAGIYESQIENYISRTRWGYVSEVVVSEPGIVDPQSIGRSPSDNDGLWTSMYGAGECFAWAATGQERFRERARKAFRALRFLWEVPRDGEVFQQPGYVARTVLESHLPDPNDSPSYTVEGQDRRRRDDDALWKVYSPRWPLSADRKWYYKTDTSSDELDGHYFFYALYHDLVAATPEEKAEVAEVVASITDHLVRNDFCLVDHDGTPTRWAVFSPSSLNNDPAWFHERGLNSLSMLSYLTVAAHVTGDSRYNEIIDDLIDNHHFLINAAVPKIQTGIGSGNQSDDEMAFMGFYSLIRLTHREDIRSFILNSFHRYWVLEFPEMNPFFNYCYAAVGQGASYRDQWGNHDLSPWDGWREDAFRTLVDFPLDRFNWPHRNSHRLDIIFLPPQNATSIGDHQPGERGHRVDGKVLPVSERSFNHWNTDPWQLDYGGDGNVLASGTVFLLPYYMGLYHQFIPTPATD